MALPKIAFTGRPLPDVAVYGVQRRNGERHKRPWVVRWSVSGRQRSRSFRTKAEAERFRSGLLIAVQAGEEFDATTGEPVSWQSQPGEMAAHEWARHWLGEQWPEWAPRTRVSAVEAMTRLVSRSSSLPPRPRRRRDCVGTRCRRSRPRGPGSTTSRRSGSTNGHSSSAN